MSKVVPEAWNQWHDRAEAEQVVEAEMATRVVIAEDEWVTAALLRHELEEQGFEVVGTAASGDEALRVCFDRAPDVVMMDVQMPGLDGIAATRALMEQSPTCVVIVTGKATLEEQSEQAGAMSYVLKPFLGAQIPGVVERARHRFAHFMAVCRESKTPQEALEAWPVVARAMRLLAREDEGDEAGAFHRLRQRARRRKETLRQAAAEVLGEVGGKTPGGAALAAA